jgi:hypothetical protein
MALSSEAVFRGRVQEMNLLPYWDKFAASGWTTMAAFAFSANHQPGNADETSFIDEVVVPILSSNPHPLKAMLRRLHFEAFAMVAEDARRRSSQTDDDDKPRKLPAAEKTVRLAAIRLELSGLDITGELEPSDNVVDRLVAMQEDGNLKYLKWEEIGRRDVEIRGSKKDNFWKPDANGHLREYSSIIETPADISDMLKIKTLLQRRGVALQMARLMSYKGHEKWVAKLFKELQRDPLPGYAKFSLAQASRVDQELFAELAEVTRGSLGLKSDGSYPLDSLVEKIMVEQRIACLLGPLPATSQPRSFREDPGKRAPPPPPNKRKHDDTNPRGGDKSRGGKGGKDKGKGKGRGGKDKRRDLRLPTELVGMMTNYKGLPICFAYNLEGCSSGVNSEGSCTKGKHLCMRCGGNHPQSYANCPKRD